MLYYVNGYFMQSNIQLLSDLIHLSLLFCFSFWMYQRPGSYLRWQLRAVLERWLLCGQHWCFTICWKMKLKSD